MELPLPPAVLPLQPANRPLDVSPQLKKKTLAPQLGRLTLSSSQSPLALVSVLGLPRRRHRLNHLISLQQLAPTDDNSRLQRHYHDLRLRFSELLAQFRDLELELEYQRGEAARLEELQEEIEYYKKLIEQLQEKIAKLSATDHEDLLQLYNKLLREYKLLQTDFELEKNAKLVLIDQIEFLSKENEMLQSADNMELDEDQLMQYSDHFQFPPPTSLLGPPTPDLPQRQRMLLPASLADEEFVLLPLKLADVAQKRSSCSEEESTSSKPRKLWRQLGHHRYSSHDLFPIQVEFEQPPTSADPRESAFDALNGDKVPATPVPLEALLKRLSVEEEEVSKQEFMKLKFELQLLRLHNEKLLSYIGYEMQRLQRKRESTPEYLDSKLIERLRDELIKKKRVLRLVSINPLQKLLGPANYEDAYGFMAYNGDLTKRVFSNGLQAYYHLDEVDGDEPLIKKHKLMVFSGMVKSSVDLDLDYDEDDEGATSEDEVVPVHGVFSSFKHLMLGGHGPRRKQDELVDDGLKYKFLTIAMAIAVIGLHVSHNRHH